MNEIEKAYRAGFEAGFGEAQASPGAGEEEIVAAFKDYVAENKLQSLRGFEMEKAVLMEAVLAEIEALVQGDAYTVFEAFDVVHRVQTILKEFREKAAKFEGV